MADVDADALHAVEPCTHIPLYWVQQVWPTSVVGGGADAIAGGLACGLVDGFVNLVEPAGLRGAGQKVVWLK